MLDVDVNNAKAISVYQQVGFVAIGRRAHFVKILT